MVIWKDYVGARNQDDYLARPRREAFIFELINHVGNEYAPDNAGDDVDARIKLSLSQKKRLRRDIVRKAYTLQNANPDKAGQPLDNDYIVQAFFETDYGQKFASRKTDWESGAAVRTEHENTIASWTSYDDTEIARCVISPYDPMFADSSLFMNRNGSDEIAYVVGAIDPATKQAKLGKNGLSIWDRNCIESQPKGGFIMNKVIPGTGGRIQPATDDLLWDMHSRKAELTKEVYGPATKCGFTAIAKYIRDDAERDNVYEYLSSQTSINASQIQLMEQICQYLTETGRPFDVKMSNDKNLVAKLNDGSKIEIRLFDTDGAYRGRIYDNGKNVYLATSTGLSNGGSGKPTLHQGGYMNNAYAGKSNTALFDEGIIGNEDVMNMIKWYLGEKVKIASSIRGYENKYVGEPMKYPVKKRVANKDRKSSSVVTLDYSAVGVSSKLQQSSVLLGLKYIEDYKATNEWMQRETAAIQANANLTDAEKQEAIDALASKVPYHITDVGKENTTRSASDVIPFGLNAIVTGTSSRHGQKTDEEEFKSSLVLSQQQRDILKSGSEDTYDERREQMIRENTRNRLVEWQKSAKQTHRKYVGIADMADTIRTQPIHNDFDYEFSSDDSIKQIQQLYWNFLTGKINSLPKTIDTNEGVITDSEAGVYEVDKAASFEERLEAVEKHYHDYQQVLFGSLPTFDKLAHFKEVKTAIENGENRRAVTLTGFNPAMVAKYVSTPDSQGVQKNYDFIRHMLKQLGDDYTPEMIKGDDYIAREIKNDMIRFNESTAKSFKYFAYTGKSAANKSIRAKVDNDFVDLPVTKDMMLYVGDMLTSSGCYPESITLSVDDQGIIKFRACRNVSKEKHFTYDSSKEAETLAMKNSPIELVEGEIGQIFEPDEYGAITTRYAGQPNKVMIPGYNAYVVEDDEENPKPISERLRLSGWKQQMRDAISREVKAAVFTSKSEYDFLPHTTSLNTVYRKTYETSYSIDEYRYRLYEATPEDQITFRAIIKTLQGRCRFPNEYGDGATTMTQSMLEHPDRPEAKNYDYYYSDLMDNHNLRVLGEFFDGIFDENMTGTAKTQGLVRYLDEGVVVNDATGRVTPVPTNYEDENGNMVKAECPLMKDVLFRDKYHDTWDRRQMAASQVLTAQSTPRGVGMAMMNLNGWTFDDGFVVSKKFAETYKVQPGEGQDRRALITGDKLSDMHGNKGVISLVVDPYLASDEIMKSLHGDGHQDNLPAGIGDPDENGQLTFWFRNENYKIDFDASSDSDKYEQAIKFLQNKYNVEGLDDVMHVFRDNENLDVVASPYSGMSRSNGGSGKGMLDPAPAGKDKILHLPDGREIDGGIGYVDMIVVDMLADVKTHFYDQNAIREGKGRKASGQLAWVLQAKGADKIMKAFYGNNDSAFSNLREYTIALGMDFDESGVPLVGYHPQTHRGEKRKLFKSPDPSTVVAELKTTKTNKLVVKFDSDNMNEHMRKMFDELNSSGGFMELPFQLDFNTMSYVNIPGNIELPYGAFKLQETGQTYTDVNDNVHKTFGLPVLSHSLRSGQDFQDGTARPHDYTLRYKKIYEAGLKYRKLEEMLLSGDLTSVEEKYLRGQMEEQKISAQHHMNEITKDIASNRFNTKYNVVREEIMATRIDNSATAVWTADPRLKTDEVAMSLEHAMKLGLTVTDEKTGEIKLMDDASVLVWRDPILHDGNVRYMNVVINDSLTGVAINPLMDKSFDGDFDGDSVAIVALTDKDARNQAYSCFSVENNLLNHGVDVRGNHPMYVQDGLDVASNSATGTPKGAILQELKDLNTLVNNLESLYERAMSEKDPAKREALLSRIEFKTQERIRKVDENGKPIPRPDGKRGFMYEEELDKRGKALRDSDGHIIFKMQEVTYTGEQAIRRYRKQWKQALDAWADKALDGIATDILVGKDAESMIKSLQDIVDHKAKGNQGKMLDYAHNIGIHYELGSDGKADLSTVVDLGGPKDVVDGVYREVDKKIQETAAYKADNTQLGGTTAQNGVAALRDVDILVALELTYPITQAILQSKHDPKDAKVKDEIVRFWGKDVWDGYKITGLDNWRQKDANGNWVYTKTPEEVQQLMHSKVPYEVYDVDEKGNKVRVQKREFVPSYTKDKNGILQPVYKENGKQDGTWKPLYDDNGQPIYETSYQKCTKEEFINQMEAMMYALKVDINPDYIERLAYAMVRPVGEHVPLKNCDGRTISCWNESARKLEPVTGNGGKVIGLTDYAREKGTLLDRMGYSDRATALVQEALKKDGKCAIFSAPEALVEYGRQHNNYVSSERPKGKVVTLSNSGMFAPEKMKTYLADDAEMRKTGLDHVEMKKKVADIGKDARTGKVVTVSRKPKPNSRTDVLIRNTDDKVPFMGQSQSDYEKMMKESFDETVKTVTETKPVIELRDEMKASIMASMSSNASQETNPFVKPMKANDKVYTVSFEYEDGSKDLRINIGETTVEQAAMKYVSTSENVEHGTSLFAAYSSLDDAIKSVKDVGFGKTVPVASYESTIDVHYASDVDKIKSELVDMQFKTYDEQSTEATDLAYKHEEHVKNNVRNSASSEIRGNKADIDLGIDNIKKSGEDEEKDTDGRDIK